MTPITDDQRAAIERIDQQPDATTPAERIERIKAALSVTNEQVDAHIEANGGKAARKTKKPSVDAPAAASD